MNKYQFLIGAPRSGAGKTMVALGLMRALRRRGLEVAPFKSGPDYIDTQFHAAACGGRRSVNLDLFMGSRSHVRNLFARHSAQADVAVVEGAMGLFDGYRGMEGSAAEVAITTGVPVVMVADAASTAFSVAATLWGFTRFRPEVRVAGVIFNRVASERHRLLLEEAAAAAGVECVGAIGRRDGLVTPSRHLGLTLTGRREMERFVDEAAEAVEEGVDIDRLLDLCRTGGGITASAKPDTEPRQDGMTTVAVARDEAFSFIYEANIDSLRRAGARIEWFSPLRSQRLPEGTDMIYLPGGYPELWARELEANNAIREAVRSFGEEGGRILAECGGLIYLGRSIDGHRMAGLLPTEATMEGARLTLGYRTVTLEDGTTLKGHEFHYSRLTDPAILPSVASQTDARGRDVATPLYRYRNTFAGYTHLYWGETDINRLWT